MLAARVAGLAGLVPADGVGAVMVTLTVARGTTGGHLTAYACGTRPGVATMTFTPGHTTVVGATVAIDPLSGRICVITDGAALVRIDLRGWVPERGGFHPVRATRLFDTRGTEGERPVVPAPLAAGRVLRVHVVGIDHRVPADGVVAVSLAVTVVRPIDGGLVTVWACGARPRTVALAFTRGHVSTTLTIVPVDPATGDICLVTTRTAHVMADLTGWLEPGHGYAAVATRMLDTRPGMPARSTATGPIDPDHSVAIRTFRLLPQGSTAAFVTVLVLPSAGSGTLTFAACDAAGVATGTPASVSFEASQPASTTVLVQAGVSAPRWCITSTRTAHVVVDVHGVVVPPPT